MKILSICFASCLILAGRLAFASDQIPGPDQSVPIAIVGATLHTVSDGTIEGGTVVFENGKITYVGTQPTIPDGSQIIEGEGKHVYPTLIESRSDLGLVEINSVRASLDMRETGAINSNARAVVAFNPDSELIPVNRANGVLVAVTAPEGGLISGQASVMMLDGWTWEDMTLRQDAGMIMRWPRSESDVEQLNEVFDQARRYSQSFLGEGSFQPRDLRLDSIVRVLQRELPLVVEATSVEEITSAVAFAKSQNVELVIYGGYDAPDCAELLLAESVPVIISAVYRNPGRRHSSYDESYTLPSRLEKAGVKFCISAAGRFGATGIRNLPYNAATAAAYGLSEESALRSITLSAAEILKIDDRVGSLREGCDATLFVADGDILETPTQVEKAFIQGRAVDLESKQSELYRKYSTKYDRLSVGQ